MTTTESTIESPAEIVASIIADLAPGRTALHLLQAYADSTPAATDEQLEAVWQAAVAAVGVEGEHDRCGRCDSRAAEARAEVDPSEDPRAAALEMLLAAGCAPSDLPGDGRRDPLCRIDGRLMHATEALAELTERFAYGTVLCSQVVRAEDE